MLLSRKLYHEANLNNIPWLEHPISLGKKNIQNIYLTLYAIFQTTLNNSFDRQVITVHNLKIQRAIVAIESVIINLQKRGSFWWLPFKSFHKTNQMRIDFMPKQNWYVTYKSKTFYSLLLINIKWQYLKHHIIKIS